jgi:hypothetical protein
MALWCRAKGPVDSSLGHRPRNQGPLNCRGLKVRSGMAGVRAAFTCPASKRGRSRPRVRRRFCDGVRCARFGRRQGARREHIRQRALRAATGGGSEPPNCRLPVLRSGILRPSSVALRRVERVDRLQIGELQPPSPGRCALPQPPQGEGAARGHGALAAAKISRRRTLRSFQTGAKCWAGGA